MARTPISLQELHALLAPKPRHEPRSTLTDQDRREIRVQVAAGFKVDQDYHDRAYPITPEYRLELQQFREREKAGFPDVEVPEFATWRTGIVHCWCGRETDGGDFCSSCLTAEDRIDREEGYR